MDKSTSTALEGRYRVLDLELDLAAHTLRRQAETIALPDLSFRLLAALVRCAPQALGKDALIQEVWDEVVVSDETLSQRVRLLRQSLGEDAQEPRYIASVRGRGYRLICPVIKQTSSRSSITSVRRWQALAVTLLALVGMIWLFGTDRNVPLQTTSPAEQEMRPPGNTIRLPTTSIDAYNAYLIGRYHTFKQTREDLQLAVGYLQYATNVDPQFAEAYAALGWTYTFLGTIYGDRPPLEVYPKAKEAALRALSLNGDLADARSLYADILTWFDWEFAAAQREYLKTIELDPTNVLGYALFLSSQQRHAEAAALMQRRIDAFPNSSLVRVNAAWGLLYADHYEQAIEQASLGQQHADFRSVTGMTWLAMGEYTQAIEVLEEDLAVRGRQPRQISHLASAYLRAGRTQEGHVLLSELQAIADRSYFPLDLLADAYFAAGDADRGFAALEKAVETRGRGAIFIQVNPMLDGYREDSRYAALVQTVGFL